MLITENVRLNRILSGTWKNFVFSIAACSVAYIINELFVKSLFSFPVFIPTVLGTALAFFIGFNNNQAYDRWWEARKIWALLSTIPELLPGN
jgi:putative membrane protein